MRRTCRPPHRLRDRRRRLTHSDPGSVHRPEAGLTPSGDPVDTGDTVTHAQWPSGFGGSGCVVDGECHRPGPPDMEMDGGRPPARDVKWTPAGRPARGAAVWSLDHGIGTGSVVSPGTPPNLRSRRGRPSPPSADWAAYRAFGGSRMLTIPRQDPYPAGGCWSELCSRRTSAPIPADMRRITWPPRAASREPVRCVVAIHGHRHCQHLISRAGSGPESQATTAWFAMALAGWTQERSQWNGARAMPAIGSGNRQTMPTQRLSPRSLRLLAPIAVLPGEEGVLMDGQRLRATSMTTTARL